MSGTSTGRGALRLVLVLAGLVGTAAGLAHLGGGLLAWPRTGAEAVADLQQTDPVVLLFSVVRWAAVGLCAYLVVTTTLGLAARLADLPRTVRVLDACSLPLVRRLLRGVATAGAVATLGTSLAATAYAQAGPGGVTTAADAPPVLHQLPDDTAPPDPGTEPAPVPPPTATTAPVATTVAPAPSTVPPTTAPASTIRPQTAPAPPSTVKLHQLDDPPSEPTAPPQASTVAPDASGPPTPAATWTIAPGDHLWHVSVATLTTAWGRPPSDAETVTYLHTLIDRNHAVFAVPGHPDLVFPGQVFTLPPP